MRGSALVARVVRVLLDIALLAGAFLLAWLFRFEGDLPGPRLTQALSALPYVVSGKFGLLVLAGVERRSWRYVSLTEVARIVAAMSIAAAVLGGVRVVVPAVAGLQAVGESAFVVPFGVIGIDAALSVLALATGRVLRRFQVQELERSRRVVTGDGRRTKRALLVGAGRAGVRVAEEMQRHPEGGYLPVAFVDDDPWKRNQVVAGLRVVDGTDAIPRLVEDLRVDEVVLTISSARGPDIRRITEMATHAEVPIKIIPDLMQIVGHHVNLTRIRPVAINDLLGRDAVQLDLSAIRSYVEHEVVLVTGAGGSIGSELCRQLSKFNPRELVLVERSEPALWAIHHEMSAALPESTLSARLVDIRDAEDIDRVLLRFRPSTVFHAAAHKHVPIMEANPGEAIRNNVIGTKTVADLCAARGVGRFVLISTDKAVNPTSVMGASKRVAERYVQHLAAKTGRPYVSVRFGNVLGSAGSVVNIFKQQIEAGGPLTVTHPEMRRYFMTIPEAAQLVLQAASMGLGGEIFLLDMGEPVKILDLAHDLIRLSGLRLGDDIEISFTGLRPGEKLFEELSLDEEDVDRTTHPKVFIMRRQANHWGTAEEELARLQSFAMSGPDQVREALMALVPEFDPNPTGEIRLPGRG